jgi:hypothetical protein
MSDWPALPYREWRATRDTLHRWMQIVGKVRLTLTPTINHWWNVPFYVSARGFTTSAIPYGERWFEMELDFVDDVLRIQPNDGAAELVELGPRTVADFYAATMKALRAAGLACRIWTTPVEIADPIAFEHDDQHRAYSHDHVLRFWRIVALSSAVLTQFRARFLGKCSPVHFFWGSFDLAVSRFSGRRAPDFEANRIEREAYSHEVSSVGWWPGDSRHERAAFYSYAAPEPPGFSQVEISTPHVYYHPTLKGFYLEYDEVRTADDPAALLLDFCQSTYEAAADLGGWPRGELERPTTRETAHADLYTPEDARRHPGPDDGLRGVPAAGR